MWSHWKEEHMRWATSSLPGSDVSLGLRGERVEQSREKCLASHGASNDLSAPKKCSLEVSPGISVSEDMATSSLHRSLIASSRLLLGDNLSPKS